MILLNSFLSKWTSLSQTTHAVIFMNINVLFQVVYFTVSKYSVEHYDIDPMDLSILRTGFLGIMSAIMSEAYGKKQWKEIEPGLFKFIVIRSFAGAVGFGSLVFALANIPLTVGVILFNTNPFFCALLG
jgi:drug/metabolite transporter (DMT)-like permease